MSGEPGVGKSRLVGELEYYTRFKNCFFITSAGGTSEVAGSYLVITKPVENMIMALSNDERHNILSLIPAVHPATRALFTAIEFSVAQLVLTIICYASRH